MSSGFDEPTVLGQTGAPSPNPRQPTAAVPTGSDDPASGAESAIEQQSESGVGQDDSGTESVTVRVDAPRRSPVPPRRPGAELTGGSDPFSLPKSGAGAAALSRAAAKQWSPFGRPPGRFRPHLDASEGSETPEVPEVVETDSETTSSDREMAFSIESAPVPTKSAPASDSPDRVFDLGAGDSTPTVGVERSRPSSTAGQGNSKSKQTSAIGSPEAVAQETPAPNDQLTRPIGMRSPAGESGRATGKTPWQSLPSSQQGETTRQGSESRHALEGRHSGDQKSILTGHQMPVAAEDRLGAEGAVRAVEVPAAPTGIQTPPQQPFVGQHAAGPAAQQPAMTQQPVEPSDRPAQAPTAQLGSSALGPLPPQAIGPGLTAQAPVGQQVSPQPPPNPVAPQQIPAAASPWQASPGAVQGNWGQPTPGASWQPGGRAPGGAQFGGQQLTPQGKKILGIGIGILLVIAIVLGIALAANSGSGRAPAEPSNGALPSLVSALTTSPGAPPRSANPKPAPAPTTGTGPVVAGFQVVDAPDVGATYDVPTNWTVGDRGNLGGPPNGIVGKGYATEGKDYCPGSTRTIALLTGSDDKDSIRVATDLGNRTAKAAYADASGGKAGTPQPLASLDGLQHGTFVETQGTLSQAKPGCATNYSIYTFAMPSDEDDGNFVMVIAADTGVPNALDADTAKRIFSTIRPHKT
ncbi:hypothetical protein D5S18_06580 [Nocardia panacis]|uniref:DUF8017 domain-containing protein n=1 Tax=Nocardia panacis TaxID=2340916 RepID=A0A3A4KCG1_9NOCA|nr:hypothetical protein [Nocardia panacis]RJO77938.1 hypothetical protein D5S18_06580 [Nocardia panacis]